MSMVTNVASKFLHLKMVFRLVVKLSIIAAILHIVLICGYNHFFSHHWQEAKDATAQIWNTMLDDFKHEDFNKGADDFFTVLNYIWDTLYGVILITSPVWLIVPMFGYWALTDTEQHSKEFIRGKRLITPYKLNSQLAKEFGKTDDPIPLGIIKLPFKEEIKQTFAVGKPGSGKTNMFNHILEVIKARNAKADIQDYKGDYVEKHYRPEIDLLFNPVDERSLGWCLFNDCKSVMDIEAFGASLIPTPMTGDKFWNDAARDIFISILKYCWKNNRKTNADIWDVCTTPNAHLYEMLRTCPGCETGATHLQDPNGKTATGIMSNLLTYVKCFDYMKSMKGDFSIREWLVSDNGGMIFVTNYASIQDVLRPMISLFIQTVGSFLLSLSDDISRRFYFILDEFGQLPKMTTIQSLMTAARSKGGSVWIGIQDQSQMEEVYRQYIKTTILNSASNRIIFNCKSDETAKFFSSELGETEYWEYTENQTLGLTDSDRTGLTKQHRKEKLISPEQITQLKDLTAYVSIAHLDAALTKWNYLKLENKNLAFVQRSDLSLTNVIEDNSNIDMTHHKLEQEEHPEIETEQAPVEQQVSTSDNPLLNSRDNI